MSVASTPAIRACDECEVAGPVPSAVSYHWHMQTTAGAESLRLLRLCTRCQAARKPLPRHRKMATQQRFTRARYG